MKSMAKEKDAYLTFLIIFLKSGHQAAMGVLLRHRLIPDATSSQSCYKFPYHVSRDLVSQISVIVKLVGRAWYHTCGLLMACMFGKTNIRLRWYCARVVPVIPIEIPIMAVG
jgi:hypothetical protein